MIFLRLAVFTLLPLVTSCVNTSMQREHITARGVPMQPALDVASAKDLSSFAGKWNLEDEFRRMLKDRLSMQDAIIVATPGADGLLGRLAQQGRQLLHGDNAPTIVRDPDYILEATIKDFNVDGGDPGWFPAGRPRKQGERARVALEIRILDGSRGVVRDVVAAEGIAGSSSRQGPDYSRLVMGGDAFLRTPLGKATDQALDRIVRATTEAMPPVFWTPQVAEGGLDIVVVNGGHNVRLKTGDRFMVREPGRTITDPATKEVLELLPGKVVGAIRITEVYPLSSHAVLEEGSARRGCLLEPAH